MKKFAFGFAASFVGVASVFSVSIARRPETIRPNTRVGVVDVGGLPPEEAARKLRVWWESEKMRPVKLRSEGIKGTVPEFRPTQLGITLDDEASVKDLPRETFTEAARSVLTREELPDEVYPPKFKRNGVVPAKLAEFVRDSVGAPRPAKVTYAKGTIKRIPESTITELDQERLFDLVSESLLEQSEVELPIREAPKRVSDEDLAKITDVVSEFSTTFNSGQVSRSKNIRLAAEKLDGVVLLPGETVSFNGTVGRRTKQAGFLEAGVYINGRHDTGVGGGICQVSTTLYNASIFGNLKIKQRTNHSMPVPYVPVGRDATVDYGNLDLIIENSYNTPIAFSSSYSPGRLTFRVLGKKVPGLSVKVEHGPRKTWDTGVKRVADPNLAIGREKTIEKGSPGHSVQTFRLVYQDGKLVRREPLGRSYYGGGTRIIAFGTATPSAVPPPSTPRSKSETSIGLPTQPPGDRLPEDLPADL